MIQDKELHLDYERLKTLKLKMYHIEILLFKNEREDKF